jgi:c(7)-type cytochrome triheme protein
MPRSARRSLRPLLPCLLIVLFSHPASAAPAEPGAGDSARAALVEMRLPVDIVYGRAVGSDSAVVFSHQTHVPLAGDRCTGCHPQPFPMLRRAPAPTHREMNARRSCGTCHEGKQAFGVRDTTACRTCHSGMPAPRLAGASAPAGAPGGPAARRVPGPHAYSRGGDSPGRVTFRHETHLRGASGCAACHPKPFRMASAPARPGGGMHERSACGACHDGAKAFGVEDSDACARCHIEGGGRP